MNTNCENNNMSNACQQHWQPTNQTSCGCGCGFGHGTFTGCQNMMGNMAQGVMPIVMPTQVVARQAFSFVEQPVIMPIECRTINRAVMVPRVYPTYTHTQVNCNCC